MVEVTKPQNHWATLGAIKAARALIKAADDLSFAAQITGGTAGRDAALCAAIAQWTAERDKQKQVLRIIELEGDDPEIGVGFELFPATLTTENAVLAARVEALEGAIEDALKCTPRIVHTGEMKAAIQYDCGDPCAILSAALAGDPS